MTYVGGLCSGIGMTDTAKATAANVRAEMGRHKTTQADLGAVLGLSQASVSLRIQGKVPFSVAELAKVAAHFGVSIETLIAGVAA